MKDIICTVIGVVGGFVAYLFGGWDTALVALIIAMIIDFGSGFVVAGVFHKSKKSENGALESRAGWKGLCRKVMTLLMVLVAHLLDVVIGVNYIKTTVIIGFIANEVISIVENAGLMGLQYPDVINKAIDILTKKSGGEDDADK